jgi:hypothetical protein
MDAIHKDNALASGVFSFYLPTLLGTSVLIGNSGNDATKVGFQVVVAADNRIQFTVFKGTTGAAFAGSSGSLFIGAIGWHTVGFSIDEAANTITYMIDGVTSTNVCTYTTPSAAGSSYKMQIAGTGTGPFSIANLRLHSLAMWQGSALTAAQLIAIGNAINHNDDLIFGDTWQPFSITDVTARAIVFGIRLNGSVDGSVSPAVVKLSVTVDMPDRHEGYHIGPPEVPGGSAAGGYTVYFDPPFKKLTDVTLANFDLNTTQQERYTLTNRDESHVVVTFYDKNGLGIAGKFFDLHAYGYGEVVP